ncbi:MAG: DUF58 domain-containing protein [Spirochaetes bacterium]|nr:DUF58 domain-containing protein [Spirochaetota bacterium]
MLKSPKSGIKNLLKLVFPFTGRGAAFFFLSAGIITAGFLRMDLASLLWGSAFLIISVYSLIGNHIGKNFIRHFVLSSPDNMNISFPSKGSFPGEKMNIRLQVEIPGFMLPGFTSAFVCIMYFPERNPLVFKAGLKRGRNELFLSEKVLYRGIYKSKSASIIYRDFLKFTESKTEIAVPESLIVFPALSGKPATVQHSGDGGDSSRYSAHKKRSNELLEVRKYFPGDDVRKLNWKLFAHTGELFLRIGEETPPPQSEFLLILDSGLTPVVPKELRSDYLDSLVEACGSHILHYLFKGLEVLFLSTNTGQAVRIDPEKSTELLAILSGIIWHDNPDKINLPLRKKMHAVIFTSPGSSALGGYVKAVTERNWPLNIYFKDLFLPGTPERGLRDLIFRTGKRKLHYDPEKTAEIFKAALNDDINRYSKVQGRKAKIGRL